MRKSGLESLFGNMIAKNEKEQLIKTFSMVEWVVHTGVTVIFTIAAITIVPFIRIYTDGVTDANYVAPMFGMLLVSAYAAECLRVPYFRMIKAAGHFKETQNGAYISAGLNIVITMALVFKFGLIGAALGTLVAMVYHTCYFVWYLQKHILNRPAKYFIQYVLTDAITALSSYFLTIGLSMRHLSYISWVIFAIAVSVIVLLIMAVVNIVFYRIQLKNVLLLFRRKQKRAVKH